MVPNDYKKQPLQKTATDILGLEYTEIRPKLKLPNVPKKKKVGIGFHSTAQSKYWNNPDGWQKVVDYLTSLGYECMICVAYNTGSSCLLKEVHKHNISLENEMFK